MNNLFISIADMVDIGDPEKRTYREINNSKYHNYSVGSLVELDSGCRLFVASHTELRLSTGSPSVEYLDWVGDNIDDDEIIGIAPWCMNIQRCILPNNITQVLPSP